MAEDIGKRLRKLRKLRGLTQAQVAERLGVSPAAIQHHESGENDPTLDNLIKYARLHRISTDWIVLGKGKGPLDARDPREAVLEVWDDLAPGDQPRVFALMQSFLTKEKDSA